MLLASCSVCTLVRTLRNRQLIHWIHILCARLVLIEEDLVVLRDSGRGLGVSRRCWQWVRVTYDIQKLGDMVVSRIIRRIFVE